MSNTSPPPEAQRFGRSQTPESPRPVHVPEPANIPVLLNQMDPVFNDTATYNIPNHEAFSPFPDSTSERGGQNIGVDEHDAVQNFFREAEHQAAAEHEPILNNAQESLHVALKSSGEASILLPSLLSGDFAGLPEQDLNIIATSSDAAVAPEDSVTVNAAPSEVVPETETEPLAVTLVDVPDSERPAHKTVVPATESETGVDYQSLLETISQSASTAPVGDTISVATAASTTTEGISRPLHSVPGLPRKPPPQEHPVEFPSYSSYNNASSHNPSTSNPVEGDIDSAKPSTGGEQLTHIPEQTSSQNVPVPVFPPLSGFSAYNQVTTIKPEPFPVSHDQVAPGLELARSKDPLERPWSPVTQSYYDKFLEDERRYVTEGIWDKFPIGSRLFVGNLPSEKVTKRDLFHKFHKHGQLAQISIKQAYGFVQFLEASSCLAALNAEQGVEIRGRKVHLEVSKPQKNTRNANNTAGGEKGQKRRRSRSPDRATRRDNRSYSDFRDDAGRRREDFRNRRSPSPRGHRQRDDYRPRDRDGRSRSPLYGNNFPPSSTTSLDDDTNLQLPRRDPRFVPDVQLLVLEPEVVQSFINWVEQGFRNKGLQASTIWVNNRFPLPAVIKRQIIEGVQAVVKLSRVAQNNSKIPLQVFDRSGGASNVNFNEYVDLDVSIAADIVLQARQKERSVSSTQAFRIPAYQPQTFPPQVPQAAFSQQPNVHYPPQQHGQQPPFPYAAAPQGGYRTPAQPPTPIAQPPNLQQLLANLRQPPTPASVQNLAATFQNGQNANLSSFFGSAGAPQQFSQETAATYGSYNNTTSQQGVQQPNVQNIMEQLARYQR